MSSTLGIVVVGSVAFDSVETPKDRVDRVVGGSATYFSMAASYFSPVKLVAVVGEDFADSHRSIFRGRDIDLEGLETVEGGKTFFWHGRYGRDPNDTTALRTDLNVFENFRPRLNPSYRTSKCVFLANINPELQLEVLDQMSGRPYVGCDTHSLWITGKPAELQEVLRRINILFVNDVEARALSGENNIVRAAGIILDRGPSAVVIKKGEHGAFLFTKAFRFFAPAYPMSQVNDPTGAGDSFAGGFMGYLTGAGCMDESRLRRAMVYGTITASFTCESFSVERLSGISRTEIEVRFEELIDLVRI